MYTLYYISVTPQKHFANFKNHENKIAQNQFYRKKKVIVVYSENNLIMN